MKRLLSMTLAFVLLFCILPVSAFAEDHHTTPSTFWQALVHSVGHDADLLSEHGGFVGSIIGQMYHELGAVVSQSSYCAYTDDHNHRSTDVYPIRVDVGDDGKLYARYKCDYCGYEFYTEHTEEEISSGYIEHVEELPVNGITNTGSFVWYPTCKNIDFDTSENLLNYRRNSTPMIAVPSQVQTNDAVVYFSAESDGIGVDIYPSDKMFNSNTFAFGLYLRVPVSGEYQWIESSAFFADVGFFDDTTASYSGFYNWSHKVHCFSGELLNPHNSIDWKGNWTTSIHAKIWFPTFSVVPDVSVLVGHETDYTTETRPAMYIKYDDMRIIDETENTFYMPDSHDSYDMREWSYDYSDRSYHVTTNEGDQYTVTYGDENITIKHGDTVNTYNYYITEDQEPTPTPTPDPDHTHTYTSETVKEPTCTDAGTVRYTCTGCGHTYTESVPALGHDWAASEVVEDSYSFPSGVTCPNGAEHGLTYTLNKDDRIYHVICSDCGKEFDVDADFEYGHTVYTCTRCGETYVESNKDSGGLFEAIGDLIADGIRWIVDKLRQLVEAFKGIGEIFERVIEQQEENAGEYPEMMSKVVAIMPEDLMNVLWFSIIGFVAVSVWRKWFK